MALESKSQRWPHAGTIVASGLLLIYLVSLVKFIPRRDTVDVGRKHAKNYSIRFQRHVHI